MELIKTNQGKSKICLNGFMYVKQKECNSHIRWRCSKSSSFKCKGILKTTLTNCNPEMTNIHNHPSDVQEIKATISVQRMKERATTTHENPMSIFSEAVSNLDLPTKARMPSEETAKRTLRNRRARTFPSIPASLQDLVIEGMCTCFHYNQFYKH